MGSKTANTSRDMYEERLRYKLAIVQKSIPVVDADENDQRYSLMDQIRRLAMIFGNGVPQSSNDFKVVGSGLVNDFTITGGTASNAESAARFFLQGHCCILDRNVTWKGVPSSGIAGEAQRSIHRKITAISFSGGQTTITDTSANYIVDELVGRSVIADITDGTGYVVVSNTATTILVTGDATATAAVGDRYRVDLSTPAGARTDYVYLDAWLDEVDATEDTDLLHNVGASPAEAQRRMKLEQNIHVREGNSTPLADYTDTDGNLHFVVKIAEFARLAADNTITVGMVTDSRPTLSLPSSVATPYRPTLTVATNGQTVFSLGTAPADPTKVFLTVDGLNQMYGATKDFTVSGSTLTWLDRHHTLLTTMELDCWWVE